jgi:hypothetical protein
VNGSVIKHQLKAGSSQQFVATNTMANNQENRRQDKVIAPLSFVDYF